MRKPLTYSAVIHVVIVVVTIYGLPARKLEPVESKVLPVELLTVAEMTNLKRLAKELPKPKPVEEPTPPTPKPEPEKPKPAPEPAPEKAEPTPPVPEEKAEPVPDKEAEKPKPEEKKPEPPKPEKKKPTPEKPVEKKKKPKFDPNDIAALLNKQPKSSERAEAQKADRDVNVEDQDDPTQEMTASQLDALRQKINQCFDAGFLSGSQDADKLYAVVSFKLEEDGSLVSTPSIDSTGPGASAQLSVLARKAIVQCAPYDKLPRDKYRTWKDVTARFTLQGML